MAAEGQNKAASSLLDLQPTAVLELFRVYPDRISKPTLFMGFHGGAIFDKAIKWQGLQYLPLAFESEGFDILGDGKLARPKIRVANKNNIITNLLQNYKDFKNAKVVRKKVQVKFLDDDNFDGGNPFGVADSKAELLDEEWLMGRKTQESKIFVEFELNSPLDLENFSVNSRGIQAKFCCWQYRGEGCRYQGHPIERENGEPFLTTGKVPVVPQYNPLGTSQGNFWSDKSIIWNANREYSEGNIVIVESPTILLPIYGGRDVNNEGVPLKTVYVSVANSNVGNNPEKNPSYWQKDGCTKKLTACRKRFNSVDNVLFGQGGTVTSFPAVRLSGLSLLEDDVNDIANSGFFHTTESDVTGVLDPRKEWTVVGWVNVNDSSPKGAGIFSTSQAGSDNFPAARFVNINKNSNPNGVEGTYNIQAQYIGYNIHKTTKSSDENEWRTQFLNITQSVETVAEEWHQYIIRHRTGTANFINGVGDNQTTILEFYVDGQGEGIPGVRGADNPNERDGPRLSQNLGNFASWSQRTEVEWDSYKPMLPQTFMIGGVEFFRNEGDYDEGNPPHISTINGHLGMWGLWNRAIKEEEIRFLRKRIVSPWETTDNRVTHIPRLYGECVGNMTTLTGGTGDGLPEGAAPILYGKDSLVAWWDGTTGLVHVDGTIGMLDIHTGNNTALTGSGDFSGVAKTYTSASTTAIKNPTPDNPRFGGFPGTDGFRYGGPY